MSIKYNEMLQVPRLKLTQDLWVEVQEQYSRWREWGEQKHGDAKHSDVFGALHHWRVKFRLKLFKSYGGASICF